MSSVITHLLAFVIGAVIGVLYASKRSGSGGQAQSDKTLRRLYKQYPDFFNSLRTELARDEFREVREFAILDTAQSTFVSDDVKLIYYEDEIADLRTIAGMLEEYGYIDEVTRGKTPLYRLRESFVTALGGL